MTRPTRRKIEFTEESMNDYMQEIYDESHNIKSKIVRLFTKWELKVKDGGEIAAMGDQIIKLIAAEAKNQDQKLMLLKFLKEIVAEKNGTVVSNDEKVDISDEERLALVDMVKKEMDKKEMANK